MRFHYVILLTLVTSVATSNGTFSMKPSKVNTAVMVDRSIAEIQQGASTNRFLRVDDENSEERVFGIKSIPGVDKLSSYLNKQKLAKYLKRDKETDAVFAKLKLNTAGEKLFENPKFLAWVKYVDDYNVKNPNKPKSMLPTLMRQYSGESLSMMLEAAKQVGSTKSVATKLQTEQMKIWKNAGLSTDELFKIYKLDDGVSNLLANPAMNIWVRYMNEFNPGTKTTLFDTLRKHYSDETISQVLIAAKKVPTTEKLAVELQHKQIRAWLNNLESPETVFKFLMLDKGADKLLDNPQLKTWLMYTEWFRTKNPYARKVSLIDTLMDNYSGKALSTMLKSATSDYSRIMASTLEGQLLGRWARSGKSLDEVLELLGTTPAKKKVLTAIYRSELQAARSS
ncbi:Avirulence protein (Avh) [Phytophthora palmivora]|uniref:RxLR effector protein n=1 Tax=Phytophthora palmivora TaxID=4796 RepID=A0A2P4YV35_9STRA|nr:Avirulence protein (Avh) [Phytophthora palmivora]